MLRTDEKLWGALVVDIHEAVSEQGGAETSEALEAYLAQKEVSAWEVDRIRNYQDLLQR